MAAIIQLANLSLCGGSYKFVACPNSVGCSYESKDYFQGWASRGHRTTSMQHECTQGRRRGIVKMGMSQDQRRESGSLWATDGDIAHILKNAALAVTLSISLTLRGADMAMARRLEGVNKPELLPKEFTTVIDVAGFLSAGQEERIKEAVANLEEDTGFKLRVLAQNYPNTPGLAVRDFWQVDDKTVVFVADPNMGNILNFNVGTGVDLSVPRSFWTRLAGKYGNLFYWQEKGEDASIEAAVSAINACLREPFGPRACSEVK